MDFPIDYASEGNLDFRRIHSTASHKRGAMSNHGGSITFTSVIKKSGILWIIQLGRGQSGDCEGKGLTLKPKSTQLTIFRLGDPN